MKIVIDENMPFGVEAFSTLGDVVAMPGRAMDAEAVRDADVLAIRSVTKVNRALLEGSRVRFVGTATIGEDHVDQAWLAEAGIGFSSAPGCNAESVAQYVTAALLHLSDVRGFDPATRRIGVIGHGNVGSRVARCCRALGMKVLLNDPPKQRETGDEQYRPLEELYPCDLITLHVPLTREGPDATYHLADGAFLNRLKIGVVLLNTSRGPVADGEALTQALESGQAGACVLDVFENEPAVDQRLLANLAIGTPHIAGYSYDGKVNGTRQIYEAACRHFGIDPEWDPAPLLPAPEVPELTVNGDGDALKEVRRAVSSVYDIVRDDEALRPVIRMRDEGERAALFDRLRKEYPRRREPHNTRVTISPPNRDLARMLEGLGFAVQT